MGTVRLRRVVAVVTAGVLAGSLAACAQGGGGGTGSGQDVTIRVATGQPISSLDPAGGYDVGSRTVLVNVYQTLLTIIPGKSTPVPDAADCQFDTPTAYTCTLRTSQTFHNGHLLRASDVRFSFDRMRKIRDPRRPANLFSTLGSIEVPDEFTVTFLLKRPDATFPYLLTTSAAAIVDEEIFPAGKLLADAEAVGSGPYRLTEYRPGQQITLDKFTGYKGVRSAQNSRVVIGYHDDSAGVTQSLKTGAADVGFLGLDPADVKQLRSDQALQVVDGDSAEIRYWAFHYFGQPVAKRLAVRRAVAQLLDRDAIARRVYDGRVTPLYSLIPVGFDGHIDAFKTVYKAPDRARAADLLRTAGTATPVSLTVGWTPAQFGPAAGAEAAEMKRQLESSGLFRITLVKADWPAYQRAAKAGAYDLYHYGWIPDLPDGDNFVSPFLRDGGYLHSGYKAVPANRLLDLEISSQSQADRNTAFRDLQALVANDVPMVPSWQGRMVVVTDRSIDGVAGTLNPQFCLYLSYLTR